MQTDTVQIESAIYLPRAQGGEESRHLQLTATDFMPAFRGKSPSGAPPALAETQLVFSNEVKSVASLPTPEPRQAAELRSEPEGFFRENWLFVFPLAMFVILASFAAIMALT
jgi:hypothetical protein